jgi:hypothetical protein
MTYVAMLALCVFVWYVSYHCIYWCVCVQCFDKLTEQRCPPRMNEVLTPRACLTLLAYTLILGEPYSVHPFFVFTQPALLVSRLSITLSSILLWVRHGNLLSDRVSAEILFCTLLPPGLVWVYHHTLLPLINSLGDSLLQRLYAA